REPARPGAHGGVRPQPARVVAQFQPPPAAAGGPAGQPYRGGGPRREAVEATAYQRLHAEFAGRTGGRVHDDSRLGGLEQQDGTRRLTATVGGVEAVGRVEAEGGVEA